MLESIFPGDRDVARRMRDFDWERSGFDRPEQWPDTLRVAVGLCLTSRLPMHVWWGHELRQLYNDAAASFLGPKMHPGMLARPAREAWAEVWDSILPVVERIFAGGGANWCQDVPLNLDRQVPCEEVYVTLSFSPIMGAGGRVEGIFGAYTETTEKLIGARRLETLRKLGVKPAEARTAAAACQEAMTVLAGNPRDIPFAAIYLMDDAQGRMEMCAGAGLSDAHRLPSEVSLHGPDGPMWPLAESLRRKRAQEVDLRGHCLPGGFWPESPASAMIIPIDGASAERPAGLFVAGVSPRLVLDDAYRRFYESVAGHIRTVILEAAAYAAEQRRGEALTGVLQQSELRYQALFNSISEAFIRCEAVPDASGNIVDFRFQEVNPAFEAQTGLSNVIGRTMREVDPDMEPHRIEDYANVVRTGGSIHAERYVPVLDRWFDVRAWKVGGAESRQMAMLLRNITKRKRAEHRAAELMRKLTSLVDNTPLAVVEWGADFAVTRWSGHAERIFGWTAAEVVGKRIDNFPFVYEPDKPEVEAVMSRLLDPANTFVVSHNRNNTKRGRIVSCEWYNSVLHDEKGSMVAILSLVLDVTEREHAEAALRESEALSAATKAAFQLAISGAPLADSLNVLLRFAIDQSGGTARGAFFEVCPDGACLRAVPGVGNMPDSYIQSVDRFRIGPDLPACGASAYFGRPIISSDVAEDPLWAPWLQAAVNADFRACWSFPMKTLGGRVSGTFAMYYKEPRDATPRDLDLAEVIAHAAAMIISRYREGEERKAAEEALRVADRRKDEFLATLAHELRNPLAPIRTAVDLMRIAGDNAALTRPACETIDRQLRQLVRLVDDLLDVSRITRDKIELRRERVALSSIIESAVETSRPLIDVHGHRLSVTLPPQNVWLDADLTRMAQVVANLLNNAAKYTPERGHITLTAERQSDEALIRVRDSGIGIPADMLPHVFEMFAQADTARNRSQGGLGLGLTIVKRLVEMHGGSVEAASRGSGLGSEFTVRLPVAHDTRVGGSEDAPSGSARKVQPQRVLVVDDNRDAAQSLGQLLEFMGNAVRIAYDGRTALEEARNFAPSLVLLDIGMPGMSGYEVARTLRQDAGLRETVLVAVTGWGGDEDVRRARAEGFDHHLTKPADLAGLKTLLASVGQSEMRAST